IVKCVGNGRPQMLLCLHEESAVAIAHGYARVAGQMMGVVLHSNVGLMHGTMAIFNAWCDRVPMLVLGATGPWDAAKRRPWIDWLHTTADQGALVRDYTKWDNQPASIPAAFEALLRAVQIADTAPRGPTYVNLDAALQEAKIGPMPALPDVARFKAPAPVLPSQASIAQAARLLSAAKNPVILAGRASRAESAWKNRIAVAEKLHAQVMTDLKGGAAFPTDHPLHPGPPGGVPQRRRHEAVARRRRRARAGRDRYRRHAEAGLGCGADRREGDPRVAGCALASRMEYGLSRVAAGRRVYAVRAGPGAAASAF